MRELEPIIEYSMDANEAKAYKIALMWQDECRREIPNEPYARLKAGSDPRRCLLFKHCFKLAREMKGILEDSEISLYIRAQIQMLKAINDGLVHALIEPHCLTGDKAWRRWKLWKHRYEKMISRPRSPSDASIRPSDRKARSEISASLAFLDEAGCTDASAFRDRAEDVRRWVKSGRLSGFYATLSPWVRKFVGEPSEMGFDHGYYRAAATPEIERFFRESFPHEFDPGREPCLEA